MAEKIAPCSSQVGYTDTERLDFILKARATVQSFGNWAILRDECGRILAEDMTPRDAIDNALAGRGR